MTEKINGQGFRPVGDRGHAALRSREGGPRRPQRSRGAADKPCAGETVSIDALGLADEQARGGRAEHAGRRRRARRERIKEAIASGSV